MSAGAGNTCHPGPHMLKGHPGSQKSLCCSLGLPPRVLLPEESRSPRPPQPALTAQPVPGPDAKSPSTYPRRDFCTVSPHFSQEYWCISYRFSCFNACPQASTLAWLSLQTSSQSYPSPQLAGVLFPQKDHIYGSAMCCDPSGQELGLSRWQPQQEVDWLPRPPAVHCCGSVM